MLLLRVLPLPVKVGFERSPNSKRVQREGVVCREGGEKTRIFLQDAVPVTMAEVECTKDVCYSEVWKDVLEHWKLVVFPL